MLTWCRKRSCGGRASKPCLLSNSFAVCEPEENYVYFGSTPTAHPPRPAKIPALSQLISANHEGTSPRNFTGKFYLGEWGSNFICEMGGVESNLRRAQIEWDSAGERVGAKLMRQRGVIVLHKLMQLRGAIVLCNTQDVGVARST